MFYKVLVECRNDDKTALYTSLVQAADEFTACYRGVAETRQLHPDWLDYEPMGLEVIGR